METVDIGMEILSEAAEDGENTNISEQPCGWSERAIDTEPGDVWVKQTQNGGRLPKPMRFGLDVVTGSYRQLTRSVSRLFSSVASSLSLSTLSSDEVFFDEPVSFVVKVYPRGYINGFCARLWYLQC